MTYLFSEKNGSADLVLTAENFVEAELMLQDLVKDIQIWRCNNEEGEYIHL